MRDIEYSGQFKKDIKLLQKRNKNMDKLKKIIHILVNNDEIPKHYKDHALVGNWKNCRDIHIEPDWLLIYSVFDNIIRLERTGTHTDLFG